MDPARRSLRPGKRDGTETPMNMTRREALVLVPLSVGAGLSRPAGAGPHTEPEVTATEDLMREHGVLRRILLIYREVAAPLRRGSAVDAASLRKATELFQRFGEQYH